MKLILRFSTGKTVLLFFIILNMVYVFMLLVTIPAITELAGGTKIFDMLPGGYDLEYARNLLTALGEEGRSVYLQQQIPADMFYPSLFAIGYSLLLAFFLKKLVPENSRWFLLCWIPLIAGLADYLENFAIIKMLLNYDALNKAMVQTASIFTLIKSSTTTVFFTTLVVVLVIWGIRLFKKKRDQTVI